MLVYFHGGGWVIGDLDTVDEPAAPARQPAPAPWSSRSTTGWRPSTASRRPFDDCYAATAWVAEHAAELGGDPARVAVGGDSAGGNLAAVVALAARDRRGPRAGRPAADLPGHELRLHHAVLRRERRGLPADPGPMDWFWEHYLGAQDLGDPYACPARAENLVGLPPALVVTAEFDPLRDEGEAYAARLRAAGRRGHRHPLRRHDPRLRVDPRCHPQRRRHHRRPHHRLPRRYRAGPGNRAWNHDTPSREESGLPVEGLGRWSVCARWRCRWRRWSCSRRPGVGRRRAAGSFLGSGGIDSSRVATVRFGGSAESDTRRLAGSGARSGVASSVDSRRRQSTGRGRWPRGRRRSSSGGAGCASAVLSFRSTCTPWSSASNRIEPPTSAPGPPPNAIPALRRTYASNGKSRVPWPTLKSSN